MSGTVQSNNVFLNATNTISAVGSGGASTPNLDVSTLSAFALLNISSINGVPYVGAGGVPANLTVSSISTLALNNISSINGVAYTGSGSIPANLGASTLTVNGGVFEILATAGAPTAGRLNIIGTAGGYDTRGYDNSNVQTSYITTQLLGGGVSRLEISAGDGTAVSTSLLAITGGSGVSISTLNVSSINGGEPGSGTRALGSFNLGISSFSTTQNGGVFPVNTPLLEFSTVVGRSYVLDFTAAVVPTQPSVDPATIPLDNELGFGIVSGSTALSSDTFQTQLVYNVSRGIRSTFTTTNSVSFLAAATGSRLNFGYLSNNAVNFNFTNTTTISSLTRVLITDLGVI